MIVNTENVRGSIHRINMVAAGFALTPAPFILNKTTRAVSFIFAKSGVILYNLRLRFDLCARLWYKGVVYLYR